MGENVSQKIGGNFVESSQCTQGGSAELAFQGCGVSLLVWCTVYTERISVDTKKRRVGLHYDQKSAFYSARERYILPKRRGKRGRRERRKGRESYAHNSVCDLKIPSLMPVFSHFVAFRNKAQKGPPAIEGFNCSKIHFVLS